MLTLTENARTAVRDLSEQAGLPASGGLRIAESEAGDGAFELALVPEAVPGDDVVGEGAATVYLSPVSSRTLADLELDTDPAAGATGFVLAPRG